MSSIFFIFAAIAEHGVEDVRGTLEYYSQFSDPVEAFKENRRRLVVSVKWLRANGTILCNQVLKIFIGVFYGLKKNSICTFDLLNRVNTKKVDIIFLVSSLIRPYTTV